jgi:hypothetical protein
VPGSRPAPTLSGGGGAGACSALDSWPCGSARPGSPTPPGGPGRPGGAAGGLAAGPVAKGKATPVKYWLWDLPATTPLVELVRLARSRWRVEQDDRERKGALGAGPLRGRGFGGWHHHVTLVLVAHGFLTLERLRDPNRRVGLSLWRLLEQLQVLLGCWAGACPPCHRPAPRWLLRPGRARAPT